MKARIRLLSLGLAVLLAAALAAPAALAADFSYTPVEGASDVKFAKYLIMDPTAKVPKASFSYEIKAGAAVPGDAAHLPVYAGDDTSRTNGGLPSVGTADFTANMTTSRDASQAMSLDFGEHHVVTTGDYAKVTLPVDGDDNPTKVYAKTTATINFAGVSFKEPGIYRYKLTEDTNNAPFENNDRERTLDVWVADANDGTSNLTIMGYVLSKGTESPLVGETVSSLASKSVGFQSDYKTHDLTITNTISGNQGNKREYFKFVVTLTDESVGKGLMYDVNLDSAERSVNIGAESPHTNAASITADENYGKAEGTYYLRHGQSITIQGIPDGAKYVVTEEPGNYKAYVKINGGNEQETSTAASGEDGSDDLGIKDTTTVEFRNDRTGTIPTGVLLTIAPFAAVVLIGLAGVAVILARKRRAKN